MHVVFDAVAVRAGSASIVVEHEIAAWVEQFPDDRLTVLVGEQTQMRIPAGASALRLRSRLPGKLGELWLRTFGVRTACRRSGAEALISGVTASALLGAPCPRWAIVYDVRHEQRPQQFALARRLARRLSYWWTFRTATGLFCISARTRDDLVERREWLRDKAVVTLLGSDHVLAWHEPPDTEEPYALAFGNFSNKNADKVVAAWAEYCRTTQPLMLRIVGMSEAERAGLAELASSLEITQYVSLMPWLADNEFEGCFAGARLVIFPSDFEGYGLPSVEAMRLRIPVVVSDDRALREVTGGVATVAPDLSPQGLAAAFGAALRSSPDQLEAAYRHVEPVTWSETVRVMREVICDVGHG